LCRSSQFDSIGDDETDTMVIPGHLVAIVLFPACAKASGEPGEASNSIQTVASNADVVVAPGRQPALGVGCGVANLQREEAS
jgi:hypothetical protein